MSDDRRRRTPPLPHRDYTRTPATPVRGLPEFIGEVGTGVVEGEALDAIRERRPTPMRFKKLEEFKDAATKDIGDIKVSIAKIEGDIKTTSVSLLNIDKHLSENRHRERVTWEKRVTVETAEEVAEVEVDKAQDLDVLKARDARRKLIAIVVGAVFSGGVVMKFLTWAGL